MKAVRTLGRILVPSTLVLLAACQTTPGTSTAQDPATASPQTAAPTSSAATPTPETSVQAQRQGAPIAVFLADTTMQPGWTPVDIQSGTLYVNPEPIITRDDLSGIQAGSNKDGDGLLALELSTAGQSKVAEITRQNPNKRLALVVGRTMMAAPGYTTPVTTGHLIFAVGTEENATAAARAVAGVDANDAGTPVTPATQGASGPNTGAAGARLGAQ